jgi:hypothetical protein
MVDFGIFKLTSLLMECSLNSPSYSSRDGDKGV